jgi:hypothetical protein
VRRRRWKLVHLETAFSLEASVLSGSESTGSFKRTPPLGVKIRRIPGYKGLAGNERADAAAKAAVNGPLHHPGRQKSNVAHSRHGEATDQPSRTSTRYPSCCVILPHQSASIPAYAKLTAHDVTYNHVFIHATAGHGYVADYCARLGPAETPSCPCGKALQAREHVLAVVVD